MDLAPRADSVLVVVLQGDEVVLRGHHAGARERARPRPPLPAATEATEPGFSAPRRAESWHDAAAYANDVSAAGGLDACFLCEDGACEAVPDYLDCGGWRLPTEAEWEIAARAGETGDYVGGDPVGDATGCREVELSDGGLLSDTTRYCVDGVEGPDDVATREPNAWGGHDFTGNVWEWVADGVQASPPSGTDPIGAGIGGTIRGGGFASAAEWVSLSARYEQDRTYDGTDAEADPEGPDLGFRLARTRDAACD